MAKEIVVVGGGALGLASALELARRGARVTVLEKGQPARESSWAGGGILSALPPWAYSDTLNRLLDQSQALFPHWIESLRDECRTDPEYTPSGMLILPPFDTAGARHWLAERNRAMEAVPESHLNAIGQRGEALWLPQVAQVRNPRLARALLEALEARGVKVMSDCEITGLETTNQRVTAVLGKQQRWQADIYVIAAGAWSQQLLNSHAESVQIWPVRGQMLLYRTQPGRLPCIVFRDGLYLIPRSDGHILAGSTLENQGFDKSTTVEARRHLESFVSDLLPDVAASGPIMHWAGLRPGSPDNIPTIGRHPRLENLYVNSGHFRYGVTLAPVSTGLLADLIDGLTPQVDPTPFAWRLTSHRQSTQIGI